MALPKYASNPDQAAKDRTEGGKPVAKVCAVCGVDFIAYGFGKGKRRYCSERCYKDARRNQGRDLYYKDTDRSLAKARRSNLKARLKRFGLTVEDYQSMLAAQAGGCAICGGQCKTGRILAIDHDHVTGRVRGLLCGNCNKGIGQFEDTPSLLRLAAAYLERTV